MGSDLHLFFCVQAWWPYLGAQDNLADAVSRGFGPEACGGCLKPVMVGTVAVVSATAAFHGMAIAAWYLGVHGVLGRSLGACLALGSHGAARPRRRYLGPGIRGIVLGC